MAAFEQEAGAARETFCRLLAACYYEPGPEFAEEGVFAAMAEAAARIDPQLAASARRLAQASGAATPDALLVDYARLFIGPPPPRARPYASAWMAGASAQAPEVMAAVLALYQEGGFEIDDSFRELPDHIAAELEFLYLLLFRDNQARSGEEASLPDLRRRFLDQHLARWSGPFLAAVETGAETDFYRELAALTGRFLQLQSAPAARPAPATAR